MGSQVYWYIAWQQWKWSLPEHVTWKSMSKINGKKGEQQAVGPKVCW